MEKDRHADAHHHRHLCFSRAETYHPLCPLNRVLEGLRRLVLFAWNKPLVGPRGFKPAVNQVPIDSRTDGWLEQLSWMEDPDLLMSARRFISPTVTADHLHSSWRVQARELTYVSSSSRPPSFHHPSGVTQGQDHDAIPPGQMPADDDVLALQAGRHLSLFDGELMPSKSIEPSIRRLDETGSARRIFERSQTNGKPQLALVSPEAAFPPANCFHRTSGEAKLGISVLERERKGTGLDCLTSTTTDECQTSIFHAGFCAGAPRFCGAPALCGEKRSGLVSAFGRQWRRIPAERYVAAARGDGEVTTAFLVISGWLGCDREAGLRKEEGELNSRQWEITQAATRCVLGLCGGRRGESSHVFVGRDKTGKYYTHSGSTDEWNWENAEEREGRRN
ncbi:uncharacterized protein BO96DRAFT_342163 [Aspergillus niger CBS 101883]|uniref:uncharacterized protein n=1 Tax=Aspergillus lacticoffeatus (strain CBS 101883) TaxID=1450533 RepID=UPI000D7FFD59|nr:uncharacterized protein BO96DRAFT_342163 [Aspergillus niger CBS 101883]PYH54631.1 hypothetical protein BO96DRAFT_342163 [Aspergillus niger CBS 101883]